MQQLPLSEDVLQKIPQEDEGMVLELTVYIRNVISFSNKPKKKPVKFWYLQLFSEILNVGLYFTENRLFFRSAMIYDDYDVTVTSYLGFWYLFLYVWEEETPSYTMVPW